MSLFDVFYDPTTHQILYGIFLVLMGFTFGVLMGAEALIAATLDNKKFTTMKEAAKWVISSHHIYKKLNRREDDGAT